MAEEPPAAGVPEQAVEQVPARAKGLRGPFWLGLVFLVALLLLATARLWSGLEDRPTTAKVGSLAPEIQLPRLNGGNLGERTSLSSYQGHPVVVNFWATWCAPCRAEFPAIEAQYRKNRDLHQLVVIGIDSMGDEGPVAAHQFVSQMGATFPIWVDQDGSAERAYRVDALPTTVFIDRHGVIQDLIVGGPMTEQYLEKELAKILE